MAQLPETPDGAALEDFVAAHLVSRGLYVEKGVTERSPTDILELDIVWTDYGKRPPQSHPVEVKSGDAHLGDVFKFYGWTQYLGFPPGLFVHCQEFATADEPCVAHVGAKTGVSIIRVKKTKDIEPHLDKLGLAPPASKDLPHLWRFSFWAQRRLLQSFSQAGKQKVCLESLKAAKDYHRLLNDAVFFMPDVRDRVDALLNAHLGHQRLAATFALQLENGAIDFKTPPETKTFKAALFDGRCFPVQACMYLAHRARLCVLKSAVDYWIAKRTGGLKGGILKVGEKAWDLKAPYSAFVDSVDELSRVKSFRRFPVFWQVFLWGWGGFLLKDRIDKEYAALSAETGVLIDDIPSALLAFDKLFPVVGGWFREPSIGKRRVLMQMPAAMRGIGAHKRRALYKCDQFKELGYKDFTGTHLAQDVNSLVRLLDCKDSDLIK